uniref:Uncharacterized protein n=1 Tax=Triticum urartu TaxID=4572 RepID=A0A8R7R0X5_TRIUA
MVLLWRQRDKDVIWGYCKRSSSMHGSFILRVTSGKLHRGIRNISGALLQGFNKIRTIYQGLSWLRRLWCHADKFK